jgi:hypothetical protein
VVTEPADIVLAPGHRWLGYRTVEVQVPEDWPFDYTPVEIDCSYLAGEPYRGPDRPYVEIDTGLGGRDLAECLLPDPPSDAHAEFGPWPRDTWQSHVTLAEPSDDTPDGSWAYGGWTLTRATVDDVQITVLASPGDAALTEDVLTSARTVDIDANGCPTSSPAQQAELQVPTAPPVPEAWRGDSDQRRAARWWARPTAELRPRRVRRDLRRTAVPAWRPVRPSGPVPGGIRVLQHLHRQRDSRLDRDPTADPAEL